MSESTFYVHSTLRLRRYAYISEFVRKNYFSANVVRGQRLNALKRDYLWSDFDIWLWFCTLLATVVQKKIDQLV